jgi:hypothetical protein
MLGEASSQSLRHALRRGGDGIGVEADMPRFGSLSKLKDHLTGPATPDPDTAGASEQQRHRQEAEPGNTDQTPSIDLSSIMKPLEEIKSNTVETAASVQAYSLQIQDQLARIERTLAEFVAVVSADNDDDRTCFTPAEFAQKAVKDCVRKHLEERTVQRWCREKRIKATKRSSGRGEAGEWAISRDEYARWVNDGLLPAKD